MIDNCTGRISPAGAADEFTKLGQKWCVFMQIKAKILYKTTDSREFNAWRGSHYPNGSFFFLKKKGSEIFLNFHFNQTSC
jgi:hypothetical protein